MCFISIYRPFVKFQQSFEKKEMSIETILVFCLLRLADIFILKKSIYARRCGKDPGSGWSRDTRQNPLLSGDGWETLESHAST